MSVVGRKPSELRRALIAALEGTSIQGTRLEVNLHRAAAKDVGLGPVEHVDGGFSVIFAGGDTIPGVAAPEEMGGQVQFKWNVRFSVDFAYRVEGIDNAVVDDDELPLAEGMMDLIQAKLNPATGKQWAVQSFRLEPVFRHPVNRAFYVQRISFSVNDYWRRV